MDTLTREKRSWNMSRIRGRDTGPERQVRSMLHSMGYRFRLHRPDLPGKPDVVLPKYGTVIFVHGCFWHRHKGCRFAYTPKSREAFWQTKFARNVERDRAAAKALKRSGWRVVVVWECELREPQRLSARLSKVLVRRAKQIRRNSWQRG